MQDRLSYGLGIIPLKLTRHAAEELERIDSSMQNRFGLFAWQSDGKDGAGLSPRDQQNGDSSPSFCEIDIDLTEVSFESLARIDGNR